MRSRAATGSGSVRGAGERVTAARVAWYALAAVPAVVPVVTSKVPFASGPPLTLSLFVYPKILALSVLLAVSALGWAVAVLRGESALRTLPLRWELAAFFGLATVSTASAISPVLSVFGGQFQATGLMVLALGGTAFVLATQLVDTPDRVRTLAWSTVVGGVLVALVALVQMLGVDPLDLTVTGETAFLLTRGASLLGNPDFTGTYLVVPTVLAAGLALCETGRGRVFAGAASVLTGLALLNTLTRGAWVGLVVGLVVFAVAVRRSSVRLTRTQWTALAAALAVSVLTLLLAPGRVWGRIADMVAGEAAGGGRLILWRDALAVIGNHPLLGTGPDAYRLGWYAVRSPESVALSGMASVTEDPHNLVLLLAATIGVPAALAATVLFVRAARIAAPVALKRDAAAARLSYSGWFAAYAGFVAAMLFATNTPVVTALLFVATGVLVAPHARAATPRPGTRALAFALLAAVVVGATVVSAVTVVADARLVRAKTGDRTAELAAQAASTAPWHARAQYESALAASEDALGALGSGDTRADALVLEARERLVGLIEHNPAEYKSHAARAFFLSNAGLMLGPETLQEAVLSAEEAQRIYPVSSEAAYLKAFALLGLERYEQAVVALEDIWEVDPGYPEPGIVYAQALALAGREGEAAEIAALLRERFPDNADVAGLVAAIEAQGEVGGEGAP